MEDLFNDTPLKCRWYCDDKEEKEGEKSIDATPNVVLLLRDRDLMLLLS